VQMRWRGGRVRVAVIVGMRANISADRRWQAARF
jgi:hypothetical protein